jgi:hypothetical protein
MTIALEAKGSILETLRRLPAFAALVSDDALWDSYYADRDPRLLLIVGEITWPPSIGSQPPELNYTGTDAGETFDIQLMIEAHVPDDDQATANGRVVGLLNDVVAAFPESNSLGIEGVTMLRVVPDSLDEGADPNTGHRGARLTAHIRIITPYG